ncbi:MAG: DUF11 domain-containing protein [Saprospiraceae bacterium]|nr:DUF11 domain-containing protein [Saprospiraceae bacterium]
MKSPGLLFLFLVFSSIIYSQTDVAIQSISMAPLAPYSYGDQVSFTITIKNNGPLTVKNISLLDVIPCGLSYSGGTPAWTPSGSNRITTYTGTVISGQSVMVTIDLNIQACTTLNAWLNSLSITGYQDSSNNDIFNQDTNPGNNTNTATPAIFDLALRKTLATNPPYKYGDTLTFNIEVFNQGNQTVSGFIVNDYLPAGVGYTFDSTLNPGWMGGPTTYSKFVSVKPLARRYDIGTNKTKIEEDKWR